MKVFIICLSIKLMWDFSVCFEGVVEVMKGMQALDVTLDLDTVSTYIHPVFSSVEAARQALEVLCVEIV